MAAPDYTSLQAIREEAGLQSIKKDDAVTGTANGTNKLFYTTKIPVVDQNYDDVLSGEDVILYDDGVPVTVKAVKGTTGEIEANVAPGNGSVMKADFAFSALSDVRVDEIREEATDWLNRRIKSFINLAAIQQPADVPKLWRTITKLYAAGLLLTRDYGSAVDTEETSKDGYKKIKTARELLDEYLMDLKDDVESLTPVGASLKTDGNVFERITDLDETLTDPTPDDDFMHKD